METRAKCTKDWGNCKINSSKPEHVAKLRSKEEHTAPETELYFSKACYLYPLCILHSAAVTICAGKNANKQCSCISTSGQD